MVRLNKRSKKSASRFLGLKIDLLEQYLLWIGDLSDWDGWESAIRAVLEWGMSDSTVDLCQHGEQVSILVLLL